MPDWIAALDGGGTKTAGALADRHGNIHVLPSLGGCNPQDNPGWADVLNAALRQVTLGGRTPSHVVMGLPGHGEVSADDAAMDRIAAAALPCGFTIMNDVALAFEGAFPGRDGVLVLAGTGSMAMARGPSGLVRVGGWGDLVGDEGSAFWIGQSALRHATQELDGRAEQSGFALALMDRLNVNGDAFGLLEWLHGQPHPRSAIAGVARQVDDLAQGGDVVALAILDRAGAILAVHAHAAAQRAGLSSGFGWVRAGSVFQSPRVLLAVARDLGQAPDEGVLDALGGGLWLAAKAAGWSPDSEWRSRVAAMRRAWLP